jgi:hypothetical protein
MGTPEENRAWVMLFRREARPEVIQSDLSNDSGVAYPS